MGPVTWLAPTATPEMGVGGGSLVGQPVSRQSLSQKGAGMAMAAVVDEVTPRVAEGTTAPIAANSRVDPTSPEPSLKPESDTKIPQPATSDRKGSAETPLAAGRRNTKKKKGSRASATDTTIFTRYFLTKPGSNGTPELDLEMEDENQAMIEALRRNGTFLIVSEWRPKVDNSTKGRAVIEKEAVSRSK
jgi:hypothetical protein